MEKYIERLKVKTIEFLQKGTDLDRPYIFKGAKPFSKNDIINEIQNDTEDGIEFVLDLVILSLDLIDRNKKTLNKFERVKE